MLDDVATDDPVEALVHDADDLADVALVDVVNSFARNRRGARIELDADHAAGLPCLDGRAEGRFTAAELEDGAGGRRDAIKKIETGLAAHGWPAMNIVVTR